jgi:hypothetical protein
MIAPSVRREGESIERVKLLQRYIMAFLRPVSTLSGGAAPPYGRSYRG